MRDLIEALAGWQGPILVGGEIERRGLNIPREYRSAMAAYCNSCGMSSDLETYWSECAKEVVFSGGRSDPRRRRLSDDAPYRSAYLDQLAERFGPVTSGENRLHPCLTQWVEENRRGKGRLELSLWDKMEYLKEEERGRYDILSDGWSGEKKDIKKILRFYAERRGFRERKLIDRGNGSSGKAFCKEIPSGLIFYCWIDDGGLTRISSRLPIVFLVSHTSDPSFQLGCGPNTIYQGADYYAVFKSPLNAVFGVFALVEIFDAFSLTFS